MLKHTRLTLTRIQQFLNRFLPLIRPEAIPVEVGVAGPVDRISYKQARKLAYKPARLGMALEPQWSTFWFRVKGTVPKEWRDGPVDLLFNTHSEGQVWHRGKPLQGLNYEGNNPFRDGGRIDFRVNDVMTAAGKVELMIESAANGMFGGSDRMGEYPTVCVYIFDRAELARFDQEAWDLYHDLLIPVELLKLANPDKLTPWQGFLLETLNTICNEVDPRDRNTWPRARKQLKRIYANKNATFGHEISAIGHAHLDTAWLWPLDETKRKALRTFTSALHYMECYPNYKFSCPQAVQYQWMKDNHPEVFAKIKAAVKRGQWLPVGGTWVEPDCNIPSGESLVRQFLYGKRFFRQEFGWDCREFWNPDVFGYSGALPQIIRGAGSEYFVTQKLSWNQFNKPHHHNFLWQGIDGSRVLTHFPPANTYSALCHGHIVRTLIDEIDRAMDHDRCNEGLMLFGYGDGGGGPTTHMLEVLDRVSDLQGIPRTQQRSVAEFFERLEASLQDRPVIEGELYFELHRGTYTTQAKTKKGNRACETALNTAELLGSVAHALGRADYPAYELERLWKLVLVNQFHDVLPGSSITMVYEQTEGEYADVLTSVETLTSEAIGALPVAGPEGCSVINTCGWERTGVVELTGSNLKTAQTSCNGEPLAHLSAPSLGVVPLSEPMHVPGPLSVVEQQRGFVLENEHLKATFSQGGQLTALRDKSAGRDVVERGAPANQFVLFDDHPTAWDAWDVDVFHLETRQPVPDAVSARVIEEGPVRVGLEFVYEFGPSRMVERVFLAVAARHIEFDCTIDWQHRDTFLKVEFPVQVKSPEATYEIQFGSVKRPTHMNTSYDLARFEVCGHRWVDLSEPEYGVALFTDCKYGYAVHGNVMRISLLRGPGHPDPQADKGAHSFRFAVCPHAGDHVQGEVVRRAREFNTPMPVVPASLEARSWFAIDSPHLVIDTVKKAEDSDGLVVRLYECHGARGKATVRTSLPIRKAQLTNLMEEPQREVKLKADGAIPLTFRPFGIITLLVT